MPLVHGRNAILEKAKGPGQDAVRVFGNRGSCEQDCRSQDDRFGQGKTIRLYVISKEDKNDVADE